MWHRVFQQPLCSGAGTAHLLWSYPKLVENHRSPPYSQSDAKCKEKSKCFQLVLWIARVILAAFSVTQATTLSPMFYSVVILKDCQIVRSGPFWLNSKQSSRYEGILKSSLKWQVTKLFVALEAQQSIVRHILHKMISWSHDQIFCACVCELIYHRFQVSFPQYAWKNNSCQCCSGLVL